MTEPMSSSSGRYATFAEFWPFYLREHARPRTRALHYFGTSLVVAIAVFAIATGRWWWLWLTGRLGAELRAAETPQAGARQWN
jgi:hypothetical protein